MLLLPINARIARALSSVQSDQGWPSDDTSASRRRWWSRPRRGREVSYTGGLTDSRNALFVIVRYFLERRKLFSLRCVPAENIARIIRSGYQPKSNYCPNCIHHRLQIVSHSTLPRRISNAT